MLLLSQLSLLAGLAFSFGAATPITEPTHPIFLDPSHKNVPGKLATIRHVNMTAVFEGKGLLDAIVQTIEGNTSLIQHALEAPLPLLEGTSKFGIFGKRDRSAATPYDNRSPPYNAVGLLGIPGGACSGALIGRHVVLTARHCISTSPGTYTFRPGLYNGVATRGQATGTEVWVPLEQDGGCNTVRASVNPLDFALIFFNTDFGTQHLNVANPDLSLFNKAVFRFLGYNRAEGTATTETSVTWNQIYSSCQTSKQEAAAVLQTDAVSLAGSSGSPLIYGNDIHGALSGAFDGPYGGTPTLYAGGQALKSFSDLVLQWYRNKGQE